MTRILLFLATNVAILVVLTVVLRLLGIATTTPNVVEMIAVAEESNSLDQVLIGIADGLEKTTSRRLDLFVRLLEPIMLLILAAFVLFVVFALLMPVIKMSSTL